MKDLTTFENLSNSVPNLIFSSILSEMKKICNNNLFFSTKKWYIQIFSIRNTDCEISGKNYFSGLHREIFQDLAKLSEIDKKMPYSGVRCQCFVKIKLTDTFFENGANRLILSSPAGF